MKKSFEKYISERKKIIDIALEKYFSPALNAPKNLKEAMNYTVFSGGKRFRPILTILTAESLGKKPDTVTPAACGIELIHNFSLIHDDLPCMDNDDFRRGKPTCHKVFGEAVALLAADALLVYAFKLIASNIKAKGIKSENVLKVIEEIAESSGFSGMAGGQVKDILAQSDKVDGATLQYIHAHKTGALIRASVRAGAILSRATPKQLRALTDYAQNIGLVYQVIDDILDANTESHLVSFSNFYGKAQSKEMAKAATQKAIESLKIFGKKADPLRKMAWYLFERKR